MPEPIGTDWTPVRRGVIGFLMGLIVLLGGVLSGIILGWNIGDSEGWAVGIGLGLLGWIAAMLTAAVAWLQELVWAVEHAARIASTQSDSRDE